MCVCVKVKKEREKEELCFLFVARLIGTLSWKCRRSKLGPCMRPIIKRGFSKLPSTGQRYTLFVNRDLSKKHETRDDSS